MEAGMMRATIAIASLAWLMQVPPSGAPPERPQRLTAVLELAMAAYPEVRTQGLQLRVDGADGERVTIGFASRDRDDILGVSRPRDAQLVVDATFDAADALKGATLRGPLAKVAERRRIRGLGGNWTEALRAEGAAYGPDKRIELLRDLNLPAFAKVLGRLTRKNAAFQLGAADDGPYWEVTATSSSGAPVTLGFEPYKGRLVKVATGGAQ
jgi:hypothetical protein